MEDKCMKAKDETLKNAYLREISKAWGDDAKMMTYFEKNELFRKFQRE